MAALAIPIVVLGSLYILSEQEKNESELDEKQQNKLAKKNFLVDNKVIEGYEEYNKESAENNIPVNSFQNSNQHTDKFFNRENNTLNNNNNNNVNNSITLMNGDVVNSSTFKHNNMQPYFGAKIRGITGDLNNSESLLDNKQGNGSQNFSKSEQAPLFRPDENVNLTNGLPNNSDFFQSRMNESMKMSNVTLWDQQRVAPGLNLGYGNQDERGFNTGGTDGNGGFNAGMISRDTWMPKTVDELRTTNNPKMEFDLNGHEGPLRSVIQNQGPNDKIGKVEKHLPDKVYENNPQRWFTTTGVEKNPPIRSTQVIPMENRIDTSREYFGNSSNAKANYVNSEIEESKRQHLNSLPITNASATGQHLANKNDYSIQGYNVLPNNRSTDQNQHEFGGVYGMAKAVIAPILDILNPTRKENVIGNLRQTGNVNTGYYSGHIYNENDKTKVTNREMTTGKIDMNYVNANANNYKTNGYSVTSCQTTQNQRGTTNQEYIGIGGAQNAGVRTYNAEYAQQNNVNKTYESRANQGNMNLFNNHNNMHTSRNDGIMENNRGNILNGGPNIIPSAEFMGQMNGIQTYDQNFNNSRMDESLLNAFKNNPYTKSLSSVA